MPPTYESACAIENYDFWSTDIEVPCVTYAPALDGSWTLSKVTFVLACVLSIVLCIGLVVAIVAGVAYGYNYQMAEFLTFTRSDVTVYMRRGQFYDKPDTDFDRQASGGIGARRTFGEDLFIGNKTNTDFQDTLTGSDAKSLPDSWGQIKDTRKYAEVLTKFSKRPDDTEQIIKPLQMAITTERPKEPEPERLLITRTEPPSLEPVAKRVSLPIPPINPFYMATTVIDSGSSQIVMRNFQPPVKETDAPEKERKVEVDERSFYMDEDSAMAEQYYKTRATIPSVDKTKPPPPVQMRHWGSEGKSEDANEYREDVDEDNVVYKPV